MFGESGEGSGGVARSACDASDLVPIENQIDVMIHELKQPLLCILVLGERLEHVIRELTADQTPKAAQMKRDVAALLVSVQQMREVMTARSAMANLQPVTSDWGKRITSQVEALAAIAASRRIQFSHDTRVAALEVGPDLSAVGQIVSNFVNNAIQALESLGTEWQGDRAVFVEVLSNDAGFEVHVHDSGKGVPPEHEKRIFDRGYTTKSERGGSGYGLWVCKKLAEALGGSVQVGVSGRLGGACFSLRVPQSAARVPDNLCRVA
jgi:signal transduction histidine kinase